MWRNFFWSDFVRNYKFDTQKKDLSVNLDLLFFLFWFFFSTVADFWYRWAHCNRAGKEQTGSDQEERNWENYWDRQDHLRG